MLDLVKQKTEKIESRFLEPACGTGNFVAENLERKLRIVESRIKRDIKGINLGLGQRDHDVTTIVRTFTRTRLLYLPSSLFRRLSSLSQTALSSSIFFSSILSSP